MNAITYTAARENLASTMDQVCRDRTPVIITRNRDQSVVMLSLEEFEAMHEAHNRTMNDRRFQMHDADGDGQVTEAEMDAAAEMMLGQMSGQQGMQGMGQGTGKGQGMMDNN